MHKEKANIKAGKGIQTIGKEIARGFLIIFLILPLLISPIFFSAGIFAFFWGSQVLDTILGNPPDLSHPLFWFSLVFTFICMLIMVVISYCLIILPFLAKFDKRNRLKVLPESDPDWTDRVKHFAARKMYKLASSYCQLLSCYINKDIKRKAEKQNSC